MRMRTFTLLLISLMFTFQSNAQLGFFATDGANSLGMGGTGVSFTGAESMFINPAGLATIDKIALHAATEQKYLLGDLNGVSLGAAFKVQEFGVFGVTISNLGLEDFQQQRIGILYARSLMDNLSIGGQLDILNTSIAGFGNKLLITFDIGAVTKLVDKLYLGVHIFSPGKVQLKGEDNDVPTRFRLGLSYHVSDKVRLSIEGDKWLDSNVNAKLGLSYTVVENLDLRLGASVDPGIFSFGIGYTFGSNVKASAAFSNHESLGTTPGVSIMYQK